MHFKKYYMLILKLLHFQKQLLFIFSCFIIFSFQNFSTQNISYCLEELDEKLIEKKDSISELQKTKLIGIGLFLTTVILFWIYVSTSSSPGDFPILNHIEPLSSTSSLSHTLDNIIVTQEIETQTTGKFYSSPNGIIEQTKRNLITENDWVAGNAYRSLDTHCQRIINDNNIRAEYIEEINEKYFTKRITVNGQPDTFIPFDRWLVQKVENYNK